MKKIYTFLLLIIVILTLACNNSKKDTSLGNINLNYDSLLVESVIPLNSTIKIAHLKEWVIDEKSAEGKDDMLFFQNTSFSGMITVKAYDDGNLDSYLKESRNTLNGKELISDSSFSFQNKTYYQFMIRADEFILVKAIIKIDESNYVDTNILVIEKKYPDLARMIESYLASIAILN